MVWFRREIRMIDSRDMTKRHKLQVHYTNLNGALQAKLPDKSVLESAAGAQTFHNSFSKIFSSGDIQSPTTSPKEKNSLCWANSICMSVMKLV